jgi:hypothetical protein
MKTILTLSFLIIYTISGLAQSLTCDELINYVEKNGKEKDNVNTFVLSSDWLKNVTEYTIHDKIVVIAEIQHGSLSWETKKYIFCDIPVENWDEFHPISPFTGAKMLSYGEKFHKYIYDYKCICN